MEGKVIHTQAWTGTEDSGRFKFLYFLENRHINVAEHYACPAFTSQLIFLVVISV